MCVHTFDPEVAAEFGMTEAVLIKNFQFWISHNRRNGHKFLQGRTWTFNSVRALLEAFPYMGKKQLAGALKRLQEKGILIVDNFNGTKYDRTTWYAFQDELRWLGPEGKLHSSKRGNGDTSKGRPIPDSKPDSKPDEGDPPPPLHEETVCEKPVRASEHEGVTWPWETETFWDAWVVWRRFKWDTFKFRYKSRDSENAALEKLRTLSEDNEATAHAIIFQSRHSQWAGLYKLKPEHDAAYSAAPRQRGEARQSTSAARVEAIRNWGNPGAGDGAGG